ncbi:Uncharacterised protein [Mycobacterium tuberculosis]|nr:Uncharacterised protein [Mycobacterium tuberculosis]
MNFADQTQNPERGRKRVKPPPASPGPPRSSDPKPREGTETRQQSRRPARMTPVVRPKTPREDGNSSTIASMSMSQSSSRQTQNPERGRKHKCVVISGFNFSLSSDPKPREGTETLGIPCADSGFACRQTQNPERGRKQGEQRRRQPGGHGSVVRPKTPRGDGNMGYLLPARGDAVRGRQTQNPERGRKLRRPSLPFPLPTCRQTQNPERGRKLAPTLSV